MIKGSLLNSEILSVLSKMGHTDQITVADAGLPIPDQVKRIDLALKKGVPGFLETVALLTGYMTIEKIVLAEEITTQNPSVYASILESFPDIEVEWVSHEVFKKMTQNSKAIIRTGECTPYANVILQSGVDFEGDSNG